jgi:hypothetical protein
MTTHDDPAAHTASKGHFTTMTNITAGAERPTATL